MVHIPCLGPEIASKLGSQGLNLLQNIWPLFFGVRGRNRPPIELEVPKFTPKVRDFCPTHCASPLFRHDWHP